VITKPKFVSVSVRDQDRALRFWTEAIGWELRLDAPMGPGDGAPRWIEVQPPEGTTYLVLTAAEGDDDPRIGGLGPVWWDVDDLDATHAELSARGVTFATAPEVAPWNPSVRWASFVDPDGTTFGLSEPEAR
jgi:catechol 2,3-dioxygenase-like lactoylglutathione lyase family enzyme